VRRGATVWIAGTRSFSAEVLDFALEAGLRVAGLLEASDRGLVGARIHDLPVSWLDDGPETGPGSVVVGTGDVDRRETVARLEAAGFEIASLIHPRAHLARSSRVGTGVLVGPGAVVGAGARLGDHAVLGRGALVGHHTELGPFATLGPGANVAGNARVGSGAFLGMSAAVRDHLDVGAGAVVAMGAVCVRDVAPGATVLGRPASAGESGPP
jgi:sugar O-acyltransferase (sialic acid O-acetyltransferase NeuD family)